MQVRAGRPLGRRQAGVREQAMLALTSVMSEPAPDAEGHASSYFAVQEVSCQPSDPRRPDAESAAVATIPAGSALVIDRESTDVQGRTHVCFHAAGEVVWACTLAPDGAIALQSITELQQSATHDIVAGKSPFMAGNYSIACLLTFHVCFAAVVPPFLGAAATPVLILRSGKISPNAPCIAAAGARSDRPRRCDERD